MFGIGLSELIIIGILALIFIGPKDLPQVAAQIARFINELRRGADSFKNELISSKPAQPKPNNSQPDQSTNTQSSEEASPKEKKEDGNV